MAIFVPYSPVVQFNSWWSKQAWVQHTFYRVSVEDFERFVDRLSFCGNRRTLIHRYLAASNMRWWRLALLARMPDAEFWRWVRVEGWENFSNAASRGQGVLLLNFHTHIGQIVPLLLARKGFIVHTVGNNNRQYRLMGLNDPRCPAIARPRSWTYAALNNMFIQHLQHARKVLMGGAIVQIVPDGSKGQGGIQVNVLSYPRTFRLGFAELADMTGAIAVPVFATIDSSENVVIRFSPPLKGARPASSQRERIRHLVTSYASILESNLKSYPEQFQKRATSALVSPPGNN